MTDLQIFTTGGTIDKVYFDALSEFQVGASPLDAILSEANVSLEYALTSLMKKDSLELTDADRDTIRTAVTSCNAKHVLITHGTDTMAITAEALKDVGNKTVVLTGAMQPARLRSTDAIFNVGFAIAAARMQAPGVYIAMNGRVFEAGHVRKDRGAGQFVAD
ncbi:MAG: asparaginase domain-containing protein [Pseudomonadota bacterium]